MKRLELPHQLADYLCPVNGLCDVYEWKTGKRIPEELIFYSKAGFQMISQKKAAVPKMIFMGQGSIGKREYEFWKGIITLKQNFPGSKKSADCPYQAFCIVNSELNRKAYATTTGASQPSAFNFLRYALILRSLLN